MLVFVVSIFLSGCGSNNSHGSITTGGTGSGSGSGSGGSGTAGANAVPGYGEGIGASGQTGAAKFLYVNPLPGGGPYAQMIQSNGLLTAETGGSANNLNPMTMAINPAGTFLFQTAQGYNGGTQAGVFVYAINRSNGSLGNAVQSTLVGQTVFADVVDNQGKFLFVTGTNGVYAYAIDSGTGALTAVAGSPYATPAPSSLGYSQPATLMAVDQTNRFLYLSTGAGIVGFNIDQTTGQLTPIAGSPFATDVTGPWTLVITPNNSFLYLLQVRNGGTSGGGNIYGFSIDQNSGALSSLPGSPFSAGSCGTVVPAGTVGIPGPDNMTIASAGNFMYDNCGIYSIDQTSGALTVVSNQGPGDWPVIDPTGNFLWAITGDQQACFHCDVGITTYQVDSNTGAFTPVPNSFLLLTNSEVGYINSIAITK